MIASERLTLTIAGRVASACFSPKIAHGSSLKVRDRSDACQTEGQESNKGIVQTVQAHKGAIVQRIAVKHFFNPLGRSQWLTIQTSLVRGAG